MAEPGCLHDAHFQHLEVSGNSTISGHVLEPHTTLVDWDYKNCDPPTVSLQRNKIPTGQASILKSLDHGSIRFPFKNNVQSLTVNVHVINDDTDENPSIIQLTNSSAAETVSLAEGLNLTRTPHTAVQGYDINLNNTSNNTVIVGTDSGYIEATFYIQTNSLDCLLIGFKEVQDVAVATFQKAIVAEGTPATGGYTNTRLLGISGGGTNIEYLSGGVPDTSKTTLGDSQAEATTQKNLTLRVTLNLDGTASYSFKKEAVAGIAADVSLTTNAPTKTIDDGKKLIPCILFSNKNSSTPATNHHTLKSLKIVKNP